MATIRVKPLADGVDQRSSWSVTKNASTKSTHVKKTAASTRARTIASEGDTLIVHRTDGTIQSRQTVRSSDRSGSQNDSAGPDIPYGVGTTDVGLDL